MDHDQRLQRALLSLDGLSVGDAFGQSFFFVTTVIADQRLDGRFIPPPPWFFTDDTVMALAIMRSLQEHGGIVPDLLALEFAKQYTKEPDRGYGGTARGILQAIGEGVPWKEAAGRVFDGEGSCGNGGAMRAAPIGAYFSDDLQLLISNARDSAKVTHSHEDGQTGAIAVALAAAWMVTQYDATKPQGHEMIRFVLANLPQTETYWRIKKALTLPLELSPKTVALILGNGSQVISSDTVPFCLWCACRHPNDYAEALWAAVSVHGDMDTNCAIVGSLVSLATGRDGIPADWLASRELLNLEFK
ncbi:MAG: ADP-ribosylglycohydrolase family protein [Prosthecobacter sp.]|uniref:ADP-ribosylglycohydrolase family protein n=1 Tax=Prosthecobacter sp. TaxID=1965333 RepID=UPI0025DD0CCA|nr:ADP-ribosylglycohydrolase family protein [Prosthecobacter sp.]MCF7785378.1 ADP-ribosylglycohydrolase family protein [Prosthecobacter sp.]